MLYLQWARIDQMKNALSLALIAGIFLSTSSFAQTECPNLFDSNSNGAVDIEDFLAVLSLFSDVDSDSDGIWDSQDDCIDLEACNYANEPSEPCAYLDVLGACGGGCEGDGDGDGICDDVDDCVGVVDDCGVCNGPGPTEVVIEDITILYDSVYAENIDTWFVYELGADTTFLITCAQDENLVINEINLVTGPNAGQFVELYGPANEGLEGHALVIVKSSFSGGSWTATVQAVIDLQGAALDSHGFLLLEGEGWQNTVAGVVLTAQSSSEFELNASPTFTGIKDAVLYGNTSVTNPQMAAIVAVVNPDATSTVYEGGEGVDAGADGLSRVPDGGEAFDHAFVMQALSPGTTNELPSEPPFSCGDPVSYQGYDYATVLIGEQCWFAENLRSENYENGDAIPSNLSDNDWGSWSGAVAVYNEDASNLETYGRLYNWMAVDDARGLCPSGWYVPSDGDWTVLTDHLGGESLASHQMKTTYGWCNDSNGSNSSGFSGLPGGVRVVPGYFVLAGTSGGWWSSSLYGGTAWIRSMDCYSDYVHRDSADPRDGLSIRCVRDAE